MKYPLFLEELEIFQKLIKDDYVKCENTGDEVKLIDNLFGTKNIIINNKEYPMLPEEDRNTVLKEVFLPLLEVLKEEEKYRYIFELMKVEKIKDYVTFQELVKTNVSYSEETNEQIQLQTMFCTWDEYNEKYYLEEEDIFDNEIPLDEIGIAFMVDLSDEVTEIEDWKQDKSLRVRVLTGSTQNPNDYIVDQFESFFDRKETIYVAKNHQLVSEHYSDFEEDKIAFNIKVYESFVQPELYKLGVLTNEDEEENRGFAVEALIEELHFNEKTKEAVYDYQTAGSSGGYLIVELHYMNPKYVEAIAEVIEHAKKEYYKDYQDIEFYKYGEYYDDKLRELKRECLEEDDHEKLKLVMKLMKEMDVKEIPADELS